METYKVIKGFEGYSVSDFGNVKNNKSGRILRGGSCKAHKHFNVVLRENNKSHNKNVHSLVANAFIENPQNKSCIDHIDNNPQNNNISNLRWATDSQNNQNKSMMTNNTSGVKGVCWSKASNKWMSRINIDGIAIHLGVFTDIEDAKQARILKANALFGVYTNSCEKII